MEKTNKFGCQFIIDTREESPNSFTERIGIKPSQVKIKGSPFVNSMGKIIPGKFSDQNLWILDTGKLDEKQGYYLNEAISDILNILSKDESLLKKLLLEFPDYHILCYAYFEQVNPYFCLDRNLLKQLSDLGMVVEFDMYMLGE